MQEYDRWPMRSQNILPKSLSLRKYSGPSLAVYEKITEYREDSESASKEEMKERRSKPSQGIPQLTGMPQVSPSHAYW